MYGGELESEVKYGHHKVNHDYSAFDKNNYIARPPTFNGDSTRFEWWKSKMYTHVIGLDYDLLDILEDEIFIPDDGVGMVADRNNRTPEQNKIYRKHHRYSAWDSSGLFTSV